jgi:hypothetical protein
VKLSSRKHEQTPRKPSWLLPILRLLAPGVVAGEVTAERGSARLSEERKMIIAGNYLDKSLGVAWSSPRSTRFGRHILQDLVVLSRASWRFGWRVFSRRRSPRNRSGKPQFSSAIVPLFLNCGSLLPSDDCLVPSCRAFTFDVDDRLAPSRTAPITMIILL